MVARTLDHIAITVSDTERSMEFYCGLLGLKMVESHRHSGEEVDRMNQMTGLVAQSTRLAAPETPDILIDLLEFFSPKSRMSDVQIGDVRHMHVCLGVPNLPETYADLKAKGVEFLSSPCIFDLGWGIVRVVFCKDPDGNIVELHEIPVQRKESEDTG
jgi:catechol 2,3-dioxygenase-like lactoylglutathione lyase family enzyme